jgi:hypothetical protein
LLDINERETTDTGEDKVHISGSHLLKLTRAVDG